VLAGSMVKGTLTSWYTRVLSSTLTVVVTTSSMTACPPRVKKTYGGGSLSRMVTV
jgi:hypothetical protein